MEKTETQIELDALINAAADFAKGNLHSYGTIAPAVFCINENNIRNMIMIERNFNTKVLSQMLEFFRAESYAIVAFDETTKEVVVRAENIFGDLVEKHFLVNGKNIDIMNPFKETVHNRFIENLPHNSILKDQRTLH